MKKLTLKKLFKAKNFDKLSKDQIRHIVLRELILLFYEVGQVRKDGRVQFIELVGLVDNAVKLARIAFNADKLKDAFAINSCANISDMESVISELKEGGMIFLESDNLDELYRQVSAALAVVDAHIELIESFK